MDQVLCEGKHLRLVQRDGWEFVQRPRISGIVGIIAVTAEGKMLLVEQYRAPLGKRVVEIPAGLAGDIAGSEHEKLAEAAKRELEEETGYRAREMIEVAAGASSSGLCDEIITMFLARGLEKVGDGGGDESEEIEVHEVALDQVERWIEQRVREGAIVDLKVYGALLFARA